MMALRWAATVLAAALIAPASSATGTDLAGHGRPASLAAGRARPAAQPAQAPEGREGDSWGYDQAHRDVVLFGGALDEGCGPVVGDTWTWTALGWTQAHPATSPSPRRGAAEVYDGATGQLLLFGGSNADAAGYYADTWSWNGTTWNRLRPATSP